MQPHIENEKNNSQPSRQVWPALHVTGNWTALLVHMWQTNLALPAQTQSPGCDVTKTRSGETTHGPLRLRIDTYELYKALTLAQYPDAFSEGKEFI